jgi:hypothetical protein
LPFVLFSLTYLNSNELIKNKKIAAKKIKIAAGKRNFNASNKEARLMTSSAQKKEPKSNQIKAHASDKNVKFIK